MKAFKEFLARFLLVSASVLLSLVILEFGVRAFDLYRFPAYDFVEAHPELGWSHIPNKEGYWIVGNDRIHVRINSKGLRDREFSYEKREGIFRILVLGDSFTEAFQVSVEDTFSKVLEYELNKTQKHFEVINAGFAGVGTDYELLFLRREGYKYNPDLVLLAFFPNDVYENYRSKNVLHDSNAPLAYEEKGLVVQLKQFLAEKSCAYNYFGYLLPKHVPWFANFLMKFGLISFQPMDDAHGVGHLHYLVFAKEYGPEWEKAWDVTRVLISELKKAAEDFGGNLAVASIPFREQVYEDLWKFELSKPGMAQQQWDSSKPDRILSAFFNDAGIPFLQLLPHFRKAAEESELYHSVDGHWNADGHRLAGQTIYNWLVEEELVPVKDEGEGLEAKG